MKIIYTGCILNFDENKNTKICIDYLGEHFVREHNSKFYVKQNSENDINHLTIRYYNMCKQKPRIGITTYVEFQQFVLDDFYHCSEVLVKAETYIVRNMIKGYTEEINRMVIDLVLHFDCKVDNSIQFCIDNCKSKILEEKRTDFVILYKIEIEKILNDCDKIAYVISNANWIYRIEGKFCVRLLF